MVSAFMRSAPGARLTVATLAALVLATGGCGSDDGDGESAASAGGDQQTEVQKTIDAMGEAMEGKDVGAMCALMSERALAQLETEVGAGSAGGGGAVCRKVFKRSFASGGFSEDTTPEVTAIKVDGDTATATARGPAGSQQAAFAKEGDDWKVMGWFTD